MPLSPTPRALLFDVFGTCVDWRSTVTKALERSAHTALNDASLSLATALRLRANSMSETQQWGVFAQEWRNTYKVFCKSIANDASLAWKSVDEHHHDALRELLVKWGLDGLWTDEQVRALSLIWHNLDPWVDSAAGIQELNKLFWTATLSNGNLSLLTDLRAYAGLEFTHIFSAEMFGSYKPSPAIYLGAVDKLGVAANECVMVAAHLGDLKAAKACGLRTIYVERPLEEDFSEQEIEAAKREGWVDIWITKDEDGFLATAEKLGIDVDRSRRRSRSE